MSVWVRWGIVVGLVVPAFTVGPRQLVLFALVDALGGVWTFFALRATPKVIGQTDRTGVIVTGPGQLDPLPIQHLAPAAHTQE